MKKQTKKEKSITKRQKKIRKSIRQLIKGKEFIEVKKTLKSVYIWHKKPIKIKGITKFKKERRNKYGTK